MNAVSVYPETTTSLQADPEASHNGETVSESFLRAFPIADAACASAEAEDLEWVPTRELGIVPEKFTTLCSGCPGRQQCLLWALDAQEDGYWAGTTAKDREQMRRDGQTGADEADRIQREKRAAGGGGHRLHPAGAGSLKYYRRLGCKCDECRELHRQDRQAERARARARREARQGSKELAHAG